MMTVTTPGKLAIFELVGDEIDGDGMSLDEAYAFLTGADRTTSEAPRIVTASLASRPVPRIVLSRSEAVTVAAAEVHTGAMIALVPTSEDARRLALNGFEEPEQLHVTLVYLGEAEDLDAEARAAILDVVRRYATVPLTARAFAANIFNPDGDEPCLVLGVGNDGGPELEELRSNIYSAARGLPGVEVPENHTPWLPHITLAYADVVELLALLPQALERVGPVTFDRVRVAYGGEVTDVPLRVPRIVVAASDHWKDQPRDPSGEDAGQWVKTPGGGAAGDVFDKLKKAIPAVIYKKHSHGTVVARSRDGQEISYDAGANGYVLRGEDGSSKKLTKKAAYDELKNVGKWVQPSAVSKVVKSTAATKKTASPKVSSAKVVSEDTLSARQARELQATMLGGDAWTASQRDALTEYTGGAFESINAGLRGQSELSDADRVTVEQIQSALRPLGRSVKTFRTVDATRSLGIDFTNFPELRKKLRALAGTARRERGFSSTSIDRNAGGLGNVRLHMDVASDVRGAFVQDVSQYAAEGELVLEPDVNVEFIGYGGHKNGEHVLHVKVTAPKTREIPPSTLTPKSIAAEVPQVSKTSVSSPELSKQIDDLSNKIAQLTEASRKHRDVVQAMTHKAGKGGVLTAQDLDDNERARDKLADMIPEAKDYADEKLRLLIERDGAPWGGDADNVPTASPVATALSSDFAKIRNQYVVNDRLTVANNASLRGDDPTAGAKMWRTKMNKMVNSSKILNDSVVYRGAVLPPEVVMQLRPGAALTDRGIISTDASRSTAGFYADTRAAYIPGMIKTMFQIKVSKDTPGVDVGYGEFVFGTDSTLRILESKLVDGEVQVTAELVPADVKGQKK